MKIITRLVSPEAKENKYDQKNNGPSNSHSLSLAMTSILKAQHIKIIKYTCVKKSPKVGLITKQHESFSCEFVWPVATKVNGLGNEKGGTAKQAPFKLSPQHGHDSGTVKQET